MYDLNNVDELGRPKEQRRFEFRGPSSPTANLRWASSGKEFIFAACDELGTFQAFRVDIADWKLEQLSRSPASDPVRDFYCRGGTVAALGSKLSAVVDGVGSAVDGGGSSVKFGVRLPKGAMMPVPPSSLRTLESHSFFLRIWCNGNLRQFDGIFAPKIAIEPNGNRVAAAKYSTHYARSGASGELVLIDTNSGAVKCIGTVLSRSAAAARSQFIDWEPNGQWLACVGVEPIGPASESRRRGLWVYGIEDERWHKVGTSAVEATHVQVDNDYAIRCTYVDGTKSRYIYNGYDWEKTDLASLDSNTAAATAGGGRKVILSWGEVELRDSAFEAEGHLLVRRKGDPSDSERVLPAFGGLRIESLSWRTRKGEAGFGLVVAPTQGSAPLPVVVQVVDAGRATDTAAVDDPASKSLVAATFLASQGYIVLRLEKAEYWNREGERIVENLDAAVTALESLIPINRRRIAALGHSRTGYQVLFAALFPQEVKLAAIVTDDSITGTFWQTVSSAAVLPNEDQYIDRVSGFPIQSYFWSNETQWLSKDVAFNINRLRCPILISLHQPPPWAPAERVESYLQGSTHAIDLIGGMNVLKKPFECLWFPDGEHVLRRPKQQLELMDWVADWLSYWLLEKSPEDQLRKQRWDKLRGMQASVLKTPPPPTGKWVFQLDAEQPTWTPPPSEDSKRELVGSR